MSRCKVIAVALLVAGALFEITAAEAATRTIVYIGARDCSVCHQWERTSQREFAARCAARGIKFRSVEVETLRNIRDVRYWPPDLRPLLAQFPDRTITPRFLAVRDGEVVLSVHGLGAYERQILTLFR